MRVECLMRREFFLNKKYNAIMLNTHKSPSNNLVQINFCWVWVMIRIESKIDNDVNQNDDYVECLCNGDLNGFGGA